MILELKDLIETKTLCTMCMQRPPASVQYTVAEHGADLILCLDCAMTLIGRLSVDCHDIINAKLAQTLHLRAMQTKSLMELDMEADRRQRLKDLREK